MIDVAEVERKEELGQLGSAQVWSLETKGGLCLVVSKGATKAENRVLAQGGHPAFARYLAKMRHPKIHFFGLAKSEDALNYPEALVDYWNRQTDEVNEILQGL